MPVHSDSWLLTSVFHIRQGYQECVRRDVDVLAEWKGSARV